MRYCICIHVSISNVLLSKTKRENINMGLMLKCLLTNVAIIDTCISYKPSLPLIGSTSDHLITFQLSQHHIAMSQTVIYITFL
jgi:hypothetical protein